MTLSDKTVDRLRELCSGLAVGLFFAFLVASMPDPTMTRSYYLEIMIPGGIVGLIVGIATQQSGK